MVSCTVAFKRVNKLVFLFLQSFGLPSLKVKPTPSEGFANYEAATGIPNLMLNGFTSAKAQLETVHPLYQSEQGGVSRFFVLTLISIFL